MVEIFPRRIFPHHPTKKNGVETFIQTTIMSHYNKYVNIF